MSKAVGSSPILIAHRGYSGRYPENTLLAYRAAYQHGARFMELDLQLTSDRVPVLHHDRTLKRMADIDLDIRNIEAKQFKSFSASYKERFADEFSDNKFTTFKKYCKWLKNHPDVITFIEIKQQTIDRFGIPVFVDEVYQRILKTDVEQQCVIISFNPEVVEYTRNISPMRTGWVLPKWSKKSHKTVQDLNPEFLFCNKKLLPAKDETRWKGVWQWVIYNLDTPEEASAMANRGIELLETNQIGLLVNKI